MQIKPPPAKAPFSFRPRSHALALEPRILFDGAAAAAVEQHHTDNADSSAVTRHAAVAEAREPAAAPAPRNLVVMDSRLENRDQLLASLPADTKALVVNAGEDALAAISNALATLGKVDSIQIFSHGAAGQFSLGDRNYTSDTLRQASATLASWRGALNAGADIQLYGCDVGAGEAGQALVDELARSTGADVAASSNDTGSATAGGDWVLEVRHGNIDKSLALSASAISGYDGLLANASPTVSLPATTSDVLIGGQFTFTVNLSNSNAQVGFAPFVDLFIPTTGKDGDDGISFVSASFGGQTLIAHQVTFDASGNATHPLAKDASGNPLVITAASVGMRAGDTMVVLELPFASVSSQQPLIPVVVTASLSDLADTGLSNGTPDLTVKARAGFQYGNDALDNPTADPSLVEAATHDFIVHPTLVSLTQSVNMPEGETATGPNFEHTQTVTVTPAPGQTISNVVVTQSLPGSIQVTAITPGAGGTLTSITLNDGRVLNNPTLINQAIASDTLFITQYTVSYASLSAPVQNVVRFYVPESDASGNAVIDSNTGDDVTSTFGTPSASGRWKPLDPRDVTAPATTIDFSGNGDGQNASFTAKSITLQKAVAVQVDTGSTGITPGDTLNYTLNIALSDYFGFGETRFANGSFTVMDTVSDGQTLVGTPTFSFSAHGVTQTVALVYTTSTDANGVTTLTFDIAATLRAIPGRLQGALAGDLAVDDVREGITMAVINYGVLVGQSYTTNHPPQSEINEGDPLGNSATVTATLLSGPLNLTGFTESDNTTTTSIIPTQNIDISVLQVNGGVPPANGELRPGDTVTFRLSYNLVTGDYEALRFTSYLPLPLFDLSGVTWSQGNGVGQWSLGSGNTNLDNSIAVSNGPGNSVVFDFGNYDTAGTTGTRVEVTFTLKVGDQPFADQRSLNVLAQSTQLTTIDKQTLLSSDSTLIESIAEPNLQMKHGVVSSSHGTPDVVGWAPPGSTGVPFTGHVTDLSSIDGNVTGLDAGDQVRLVTAIENTGGGGAYDVATSITLPTDLAFVGGNLASANLLIYRGNGVALVAGQDYSVAGNTITFLDQGSVPSLLPGRPGTTADTNGGNVIVITYDTVVAANIDASRTLQSTATLSNYASVDGGTDFTPVDLTDLASEQIAAPEVRMTFAGGSLDNGDSSATHTNGNELVVGEGMRYDIIVTLPEGNTRSLRLDDLVPPGMRLDTSFNGGLGYELITTVAGSAALTADFNGTVTAGALGAAPGDVLADLGKDGVDARITFSASDAVSDNVTGNNSFVIRVQLVVSNTIDNQANRALANDARLVFSDPDGDTPNGVAAVDRTVALTGGKPTAVLREPTLQIIPSALHKGGYGVDEGNLVEYTIEIRNGSASTDFDAFDISFADTLPTQLSNLTLIGVTYQGSATNNGGADFELVGGQLRTVAGANVDIAKGSSIVLRVAGTVNATAANTPSFDNLATVQWTSLNGTANNTADPAGERTGLDGLPATGILNDYRTTAHLVVPVAQATGISRVGGLPDTAAANPTYTDHEPVTIGEIVRYRVVNLLPEGQANSYQLRVTLANGLDFMQDGTVRIAFISSSGIETSVTGLITGGTLQIVGNQNNAEALPISATLAGPSPTGVLASSNIVVNPLGGGNTEVLFNLGTLINHDADADLEGISIEFNARVNNQASNIAGVQLAVTAQALAAGNPLSIMDTVYQDIVEPAFTGLDKHIIDFNPNPSGTTGTATVEVSFTENGGLAAFNTHLTDSFPGGSNYILGSIKIGNTSYTPGNLPAGVSVSTSGGLTVDFAKIDVGTKVSVVYQVTVPNSGIIASSNASLTWSSLAETFTAWGGSSVGADSTVAGERTGSGVAPNTYVLSEGAGLGVISGKLWDDTASADASTTPDGVGLPGQTVTLTWGGLDGDLTTTADNKTFTTTTDLGGQYRFGVLPSGVFRIDTPTGTISYPQPIGDLRVRIDSDAASPLGRVDIALGEGTSAIANAGYVQQNDAPVNHLPAAASAQEDTAQLISGLSISDVDAGTRPVQVILSVLQGTLYFSSPTAGVTVLGENSAAVTLQGSVTAINAALAKLTYLGNADFNGSDTLTISTNDFGAFGDHDGDGMPGESADDALFDLDMLSITVNAVNDVPVANDDTATAVEAGGTNNGQVGVDPRGNVLGNDSDVDVATNSDRLRVSKAGVHSGTQQTITDGAQIIIAGQYGNLVISSGGGYQYVVDNSNAAVQALRTSGQTLTEQFDYTLSDLGGLTDSAVLTVTLRGANDAPTAVSDSGFAVEAGGVANGSGGSDATGNVMTNDSDVDGGEFGTLPANGEALTVTGVRGIDDQLYGPPTLVPPGSDSSNGASIAGQFGTLYLGADGSYRYVIDNNNITVQRLGTGQTLQEVFSYRLTDLAGLNSIANLNIQVRGNNDNPVASNDVAQAQAKSSAPNSQESNPIGNVITSPSRPGNTDNGVDSDVDAADRPNTRLRVGGVRTGTEAAVGALTSVAIGSTATANATVIVGTYGTLTIGADGSYSYDVDSTNAAVIAHSAIDPPLIDSFTYQLVDTASLTDLGELNVTVFGVNDPPVAQNAIALVMEKGGINDSTPGRDITNGTVLLRDHDPDGDPLTVTAIRTGAETDIGGTSGTIGQPLIGLYGTLTLRADGSYDYTVDNSNLAVQALRQGDLLVERFTYTVTDSNSVSDQAELIVVVSGQNDVPEAGDDNATAIEAGGRNNDQSGTDPTGNVLTNDFDDDGGEHAGDVADYGETQAVSSVRTGTEAGIGTNGVVGSELRGSYGWLTLNADGSYSYRVDNSMTAVQALRSSANTLSDSFSYTVIDAAGTTDRATLNVTIRGANDTPVAKDDAGTAIEAGGIANGTPGSNATGNVLANDQDVDAFGETLNVTGVGKGIRNGTLGSPFAGDYGSLTLNANGSYTYVVDNSNPLVEALRTSGQTLSETFNYTIKDLNGASSTAVLTITIEGRDDTPVGRDDTGLATEAGGHHNDLAGSNPTGNVLSNDSDVDTGEKGTLDGIRTGGENTAGTLIAIGGGVTLNGRYGTLAIAADGSYYYFVDDSKPAVDALKPGDFLVDVFTYSGHDKAGATDTAELRIIINGAWDAPVGKLDVAYAVPDSDTASEISPSGNVLTNDRDVDTGDSLVVSGIRTGHPADAAVPTGVNPGTSNADGTLVQGTYGQLIIGADGTYTYHVDSSNPAIQNMGPLDFVNEPFTYEVKDLGGQTTLVQLTIVIRGRNEAPVGVDDSATAIEAGGIANTTPGVNPSGNVLSNDSDIDAQALTVTAIRTGDESGSGATSAVGTALRGQYGTLTINADGSWHYELDNSQPEVEALRTGGNTLVDTFTYTFQDIWQVQDQAVLRITIQGSDDYPLASDDSGVAVEAGGVRNSTPGSDATGNVVANDSDIDSPLYGETLDVASVTNSRGQTASAGTSLDGLYGTLVIDADGSYRYQVDNSNPTVEALRTANDTLGETFSYRLVDAAGAETEARLTIRIQGANDNPRAQDDGAFASEAAPLVQGQVLPNDADVDANDRNAVVGIRTGAEAGSGVAGTVGQPLAGLYGTLVLNADGSYTYLVDVNNPAVQNAVDNTLVETFTYTVEDLLHATDTATLRIVIAGNRGGGGTGDELVANDDAGRAIEAGGVFNTTPGADALGNVLNNDISPLGEAVNVVSVSNGSGQTAQAGTQLQGQYGTLLISADGSYRYQVDNSNPTVEALRTPENTVSDTFTYRVRDTTGAESTARLTIQIQGANDNPRAQDDSAIASEAASVPQVRGQVLSNDGEVDANDSQTVVKIRTGVEAGSGTDGVVGQPLAGLYGTLILNADGSYTYRIDAGNPAVQAAVRTGQILQDSFTYTVVDRINAPDQATLVIYLDPSTPNPPVTPEQGGGHQNHGLDYAPGQQALPDVDPIVFVSPEVERNALLEQISGRQSDGSDIGWLLDRGIRSSSLGAGLGQIDGQFVARSVSISQMGSDIDLAWILGRPERLGLGADGLLMDPSLFTIDADDMFQIPTAPEHATPERTAPERTAPNRTMPNRASSVDVPPPVAQNFRSQLQVAARQMHLPLLAVTDTTTAQEKNGAIPVGNT
ncbi:Calcium-binding lectin RapA2 [Andreprevotia sp. IGB-42]|uniref:VCBS domain-containing protein n=1 Tax=Andreprevotia sp. IGB-42 TaxID=2497473 RepID=UPI00135A264A|nr:VCBS domain-containing protein [Andreprevotia sp. IGB-42]KAF0813328.1 Calcium-binding lectin RapA2 [Andreprevotia sp. IGB-42]